MMKNLKQIIAVYRIERQRNEKLQSKKAAKKTLQLIQAIGRTAIPYGGFSCNIDQTVEDLDVFQILQSIVEE